MFPGVKDLLSIEKPAQGPVFQFMSLHSFDTICGCQTGEA